ncbi:MAG: hypothetical protein REI64_02090 [Pedobacter sp.]|uniref:hypothetical protein n=1 Tax=Pedobacter sp. TaxID=1411316 RepID=UPI002806B9E2|nr:hypothetical protein [Pedobacter sp.]MDQ8003557.1 hypothetical protein [Pedobacter sp.]
MLKHHGFLEAYCVSSFVILLSYLKANGLPVAFKILGFRSIIFLKFVKSKLMLHKEQGIYYFNWFNETLSLSGDISHSKEKIVHVNVLCTLIKFERQY